MKKNLFIILGIFLVIILILVYFYYNAQKAEIIAKNINIEYEQYLNNDILGSQLITLINKAINENERNDIQKDKKNIYNENEENSTRIEVKFSESDKVFSMEAISSLGTEQFIKNYSNRTFKCVKKEYHSKTNRIKYILFEETTDKKE